MNKCPKCGYSEAPPEAPPEPPLGTWVRDRFGGISQRRIDSDGQDGWGLPGFYSGGKWEMFWNARGPLVECPPWGIEEDASDARDPEVSRVR